MNRKSSHLAFLAFVFASSFCPYTIGGSLPQFLVETKTKYLVDIHAVPSNGDAWIVSMGNEAGDLDTVASSIAFSWIQSQVHQTSTVPLIRIASHDFYLRPENLLALSLVGISDPAEQLLTITDTSSFSPFPSTAFALVDHNHLGASFAADPEHANVTAVIDHHKDEGLYPNASPRIIKPTGSCSSHIAHLIPAESDFPQELATLLLTAILIDTNALKPGGKGIDNDVQAVAFLAPRSTFTPSLDPSLVNSLLDVNASTDWTALGAELNKVQVLKDITKQLKDLRNDVSGLSGRDILRRDYKEYEFTLPWAGGAQIKAGLAAIPISLDDLGKVPGGSLEDFVGEWATERETSVLGVLTKFKNSKGKDKREMGWVVLKGNGKVDVDVLAKRLFAGLEASKDLRVEKDKTSLKDHKLPKGAKGKAYTQGTDAGRKVVAPVLQKILESN